MEGSANSSVSTLKGVGPALAGKLERLGILCIADLLFHLPLRYQDRTQLTPIAAIKVGREVLIEGEVRLADVGFGRRRSLIVKLEDGSGLLTLRFFHFSAAQKNALSAGTRIRCFGEARHGASGPELYHPEYRRVDDTVKEPTEDCLTPVYPSTDGVSQLTWRKLCTQALGYLDDDSLPELLQDNTGSIADALRYLHNPPPNVSLAQIESHRHPAQLRLAFEELVAHNLALQASRQQIQRVGAPDFGLGNDATQTFITELPFELTAAQDRVVKEISEDLDRSVPMLRLLQGDVGSGKTVVAACAAIQAIASGFQVAIMAPTEILAQQHLVNFEAWFGDRLGRLELVSGKLSASQRRDTLARLATGESSLAVGTHALFQDAVNFSRLGLVIVDEQHRFGVHQRLALTQKVHADYGRPHQLIMTATPIPRTLSMVAYADLDCSIIDELPPGRQPINTVLIDVGRRDAVLERVSSACEGGRQAYWVCTLIEESEQLQAQAAEVAAVELSEALPGTSVGLLHGRMRPAAKDAIMASFKAGDIQLLVATTVIEVGVDVPNATLMIIENPERLGLAQLHQLRGRVGRGPEASFCVLLYQSPLSRQGRDRLAALRESNDGFYIAEKDLELRGPGEVLGTRQTGLMQFRIADLGAHADLLERVAEVARDMIITDQARAHALINRWLGDASDYGAV